MTRMRIVIGVIVLMLVLALLHVAFTSRVDCVTRYHCEGLLVDAQGDPVEGWVGASLREEDPETRYGSVSNREEWGHPEETYLGLSHTDAGGQFTVNTRGAGWGYMLVFGSIPFPPGAAHPPEVAIVDQIFLYVHDGKGWHTVRVQLRPDQQARSTPGERWIAVNRLICSKVTRETGRRR